MAISRWKPKPTFTAQEKVLMSRLGRTRKLFAFLRAHRDELFDDVFQAELEGMYRDTGAGRPPLPPALLAMAVLLQGYTGMSDAEAVEMAVVDLRWQLVLDCLGATKPAFSQGALHDFRARLIRTDMDRRLLERTVELARRTRAFDWKKLPKSLRVAMDSSPLEGAGRVEDTVNLLAHAARKVVGCAAKLLAWSPDQVALKAGIPLVAEGSVKRALDINWNDRSAKQDGLNKLVAQVERLDAWIERSLPGDFEREFLREDVETLAQVREQDLEPDPANGGRVRIRRGVAKDRRVSIEDPDMRHGRKTKSKRFNGYKRHVASDLDTDLIMACAITPANRPEVEAGPPLKADIENLQASIESLYVDRGYINSPIVNEVIASGGEVICKPWETRNGELFRKDEFKLNMRELTITCPAGETELARPGSTVQFDADACDTCPLRSQCTTAALGVGRTVSIADDERLQKRLRKLSRTRTGRQRLRERVPVEHRLAHISRRQGRRARYRGARKNLFDLRRVAAIQNLETIQRRTHEYDLANAA